MRCCTLQDLDDSLISIVFPCGNLRANHALRPSARQITFPPTYSLAPVEAPKPAYLRCFRQASIVVATVGIHAEHARAMYCHRAAIQRQARCLAQQIGPSRSLQCRRTTRDARRDLDRAKIPVAVRPLRCCDWREVFRGVLVRNMAKQRMQYVNHVCKGPPNTCAVYHSIYSLPTRRVMCASWEQCHRQRVIADMQV
jgi:hypothetical protein